MAQQRYYVTTVKTVTNNIHKTSPGFWNRTT